MTNRFPGTVQRVCGGEGVGRLAGRVRASGQLWVSGRVARGVVLMLCMGSAAMVAVQAPRALAQTQAQRVLDGKVENSAGAGMKATVYLKDGHTLAVRSYVAGDDGTYRFGQLAQNADYEVWAEANGKKSSTRNISSFDTRNEFHIMLKIDTK